MEKTTTVDGPDDQLRASQAADRLGPLALAVAVVRKPAVAMNDLAERPGRRWFWPLAALTVLSGILAMLVAPRTGALMMEAFEADGMAAEGIAFSQSVGVAFAVVGAPLGVILALFAGAAVLHFISTIMGGQQGYAAVLATVAWAKLPLVLRELLRVLWFGTHPTDFDTRMEGLAGLLVSDPLAVEGSYGQVVLAQIEVWSIWYLVLLWFAVRAFARVSKAKALTVGAIYVGLGLAMDLVGVSVSQFFAGFGG